MSLASKLKNRIEIYRRTLVAGKLGDTFEDSASGRRCKGSGGRNRKGRKQI